MKTFTNRQRVLINRGPLEGLTGTVWRLRKSDNGAWIQCDERPEMFTKDCETFPFPADDPDGRGKHTIAFPEDCEPIK